MSESKQTKLIEKPQLNEDFKLFTLTTSAKGQGVEVKFKASDTKQIKIKLHLDNLDGDIKQRFSNALSAIDTIVAKTVKPFSAAPDGLALHQVVAGTRGKDLDKCTTVLFKFSDHNGPKKNLLCSGELTVEQLSSSIIDALNVLSDCFDEISDDSRFVSEDEEAEDDDDTEDDEVDGE
jgi:hypothetical protein